MPFMTNQDLILLLYLLPPLVMSGLAFSHLSNIKISSTGLILAVVIGITLTILHGPVHPHVPFPRYFPLIIITLLSGVSFAIILILRRYIRGFFPRK